MPNSLVAASPNTNNNNLYNGGSEWQNTFQNLPDYYQTGSRNYDPEIGRFISVDPLAESSASLTNYHYAGNNPIMGNDPTGNCDPNVVEQGCPIIIPPVDQPAPIDTQTGGDGGGDLGTDYSGNSVLSTSSSYNGTYNNGDQSGTAITTDPAFSFDDINQLKQVDIIASPIDNNANQGGGDANQGGDPWEKLGFSVAGVVYQSSC